MQGVEPEEAPPDDADDSAEAERDGEQGPTELVREAAVPAPCIFCGLWHSTEWCEPFVVAQAGA